MHIRREFFRYVIPSMLAFALSGIYAIADGFFVGNALGDDALAAVNIAFPLTAFLQAVGTGIGMGGAIEYAIHAGSKHESLGKQYGVKTVFIPNVIYEDERVSSTRIRDRLVNKDVDGANRMLTQPYYIYGHVAEGKKLGRQLGFPTVNILAHEDKLFPPNGVYATATVYEGKLYYGMTNVGYNPTVNGKRKTVETNLFDFDKVIYGEPILTFFFKWLRDENKFESVEALRQQLTRDIVNAKEYFLSEEYKYWKENVESEYKTVEK